jgi:hypothetical protein
MLRHKMYREVYENVQKSVVDAIISYLYYVYLNFMFNELSRLKYQHLKESFLGTLIMSSDLLISHICSVLSNYKSHNNALDEQINEARQLCKLIPTLRAVFATVSHSGTILIDNRSALYVIKAHKEFIRLFVDKLKDQYSRIGPFDGRVIAAVVAGSRILSGSLNRLLRVISILKLKVAGTGCLKTFMPIHYMFNRLGSKLDSAYNECIKSQKDQASSSVELCLSSALETVLSDEPIVAVVYIHCESDKDFSDVSFRQLEEDLAKALALTYLNPLGAQSV